MNTPDQILTVDQQQHRYFVERYGQPTEEAPGTNRIMRQAGLIDASYYTEEVSMRGTLIHAAIVMEYRAKRARDRVDLVTMDSALKPYFRRWLDFLGTDTATIVEVEKSLLHERMFYASTLDQIIRRGNKTGVRDTKTGYPAPWHVVQLAAYFYNLRTYQPVSFAELVYLHPDQVAEPVRIPTLDLFNAWKTFQHAHEVWKWRNRHGDRSCFDDKRSETIAVYASA